MKDISGRGGTTTLDIYPMPRHATVACCDWLKGLKRHNSITSQQSSKAKKKEAKAGSTNVW